MLLLGRCWARSWMPSADVARVVAAGLRIRGQDGPFAAAIPGRGQDPRQR